MNDLALISGAALGGLGIILGAFGAHALKKILSEESLKSFETGVKYQMYHALVLLFIGMQLESGSSLHAAAVWLFLVGTVLFSFSIYVLSLGGAKGWNVKYLGPITPLGGLFLLSGWICLVIIFIKI